MTPEAELAAYRDFVRAARARSEMADVVVHNFLDGDLKAALERYRTSAECREILRALRPYRGERLLEIGAGRGILSSCLAEEGFRVTAVDINPDRESGLGARETCRAFGPGAFDAVLSDIERLAFRDSQFALVVGRAVLHHASSLHVMVAEIARVLKPGGRFVGLAEHTLPFWGGRSRFLRRHPATRFGVQENAYRYSEYACAFRRAGFARFGLFPRLDLARYRASARHRWRRGRSVLRQVASRIAALPVLGDPPIAALYLLAVVRERYLGWPGKTVGFLAQKDA